MKRNPESNFAAAVRCVSDRSLPEPRSERVIEACWHLTEEGVLLYTPPASDLFRVLIPRPEKLVDEDFIEKAAVEYLLDRKEPARLTDFISKVVVPAPITLNSIREVMVKEEL